MMGTSHELLVGMKNEAATLDNILTISDKSKITTSA